jgi:tetratricopeptide (TPR) repeat protein
VENPGAHLSPDEIDVLVRSRVAGTDEPGQITRDRADAIEHLATCAICRLTMDRHIKEENRVASLRAGASSERGPECPAESQWPRYTAGLVEPEEGSALVQHVAACDYCGSLLRETIADFADQLTPVEESFLNNLESSQARWQRQVAAHMCESQSRRSVLAWIRQHLWHSNGLLPWAYAGAAAVLAISVFVAVFSLQETPVENLLATAYTQQRTIEMRIPQAGYARVRLARGSVDRSRLDRPPALLEGEARIARELQQHPNSPALLQAMGRADLLDWNYQAAIRTLRRALELTPSTSPPAPISRFAQSFRSVFELAPSTPSVLIDLASAYFQSAEANQHRASDYATAIELLDQALKSTPDDPVALFNRAIVFERMGLGDRAIEDWQHYLKVDPDSGWASEARNRLADIQRSNAKTP